jgi:hypothetical protein
MEEAATNENNSNEGLQPDSDMQQSGPERIPGSSPLPNQPLGDADPGEGAPYSGTTPREKRRLHSPLLNTESGPHLNTVL